MNIEKAAKLRSCTGIPQQKLLVSIEKTENCAGGPAQIPLTITAVLVLQFHILFV